jgi:hypothetical protein
MPDTLQRTGVPWFETVAPLIAALLVQLVYPIAIGFVATVYFTKIKTATYQENSLPKPFYILALYPNEHLSVSHDRR